MCGTSKDCAKLCVWITPVSMCLVIATMGFSMVGSCLYGMHFSYKAENDFLPWKCKITKTFEFRGTELREWIDAYPVNFSEIYGMQMKDDSYLRREIFMTKTENYTNSYMEYICNLYGYNGVDKSVEEDHTIIWDVEKMDSFFKRLVFCGLASGLMGMFAFMLFWKIDNAGEVMHTKVKQIFFVLIFATAMFIAGICGVVIDLFPYKSFGKLTGGIMLGISLCYPCYCLWATCKVVEDVGLRPTSAQQAGAIHGSAGQSGQNYRPSGQGGQIHRRREGENEMATRNSTEGNTGWY